MTLMGAATAVILAAAADVNVFAEYVCEFTQAAVHESIQAQWDEHDDSYIEQHRGIGKTVQAAVRSSWDIGRDPKTRIKFLQQNDTEVKKTVRMVRQIIESPRYRQVFPHIKPDPSCWGSQQFRVIVDGKAALQRDPTFEGCGIFGRAGGRWDILYADDICDLRNAVQQPAMREQVKEAWNNTWLPMADISAGTPRVRKIGTCYHVSDITADWREFNGSKGSLLRHPVVNFQSPWSEVFTEQYLQSMREKLGPIAFGRAYELNPISSEILVFSADWLDASLIERLPDEGKKQSRVLAAFDFAFSEKRMDNDPDWSVCLIGRVYPSGHLYPVAMIRERTTFPEFCDKAIRRCVEFGVERGVGESNGPQKGLVQQLNRTAPFPITGVERDRDKITRAAEKQAFVESKRLHMAAEYGDSGNLRPIRELRPLYDEMTTFPAGDHDDTVDAVIDLMQLAVTRPARVGRMETDQVRNPHNDRLTRLYG